MPRSIVMGNGNMLTAMDSNNMLEDFYFPYVGMEDHIAFLHFHRIGVFVDNQFSWLYEKDWKAESRYIEETLVTDAFSRNERLRLELKFNDFVYPFEDFLMRKITIENKADYKRDIKLFFGQDFHLYGDKQLDTAFYQPKHKAVVHFRKRRYFWISGMTDEKIGVDSFTTGKSEYRGLEGTWRDAEDGELHEHGIEQGSVDSTVQFNLSLEANSKTTLYFWICAGKNLKEVTTMHELIAEEGPETMLRNTINYWNSWVNKDQKKYVQLDRKLANALKQSLMIVRTQVDNRGGILAANDSDIMKFNKDTYSYVWPRDGAWVVMGLDRAGYGEISQRFFEFCADVITEDGYLLPKYNPDKSVGSSWHPWYKDGKEQLAIQEDETALVLYALWNHFTYFKDIEFLQKMYSPLIKKAANFLADFVDKKTGLPKPSYDLWERDRGIFSYTAATVYAGLNAASQMCNVLGHFHHRERYEKAAQSVQKAILKHLYDKELGRFLKRIEIDEETGEVKKDTTVDASLHGLWMLGVLPADDPRIVKTNEVIFNTLSVPTHVGGLTRSERDDYQRVNGNYGNIEGNPWIITSLWHAQWLLAKAKTKKELKEVEKWLQWTMSHMNPAGILPEQLNPFTGEHLSVAPLTWSHSTFIDTVLQYEEKLSSFKS